MQKLVLHAFLSLQPSMFLGQVAVAAQHGLAYAVACGAVANAGALISNAIYSIVDCARIYWFTAHLIT